MVNVTKWVIIGAGLLFLGLFTKEAAATSFTGALSRSAAAGSGIGSAIGGIGSGIGAFGVGILRPLWEIKNLVGGFMNLGGVAQKEQSELTGQGGGFDDSSIQGGGSADIDIPIIPVSVQSIGTGFQYYYDPSISSQAVTNVTVHGQELPLSVEAVQWYQDLGVEVSSGGGSNDTTGGGGGWASNVSTPSGGVASGNLSLSGWGA